MINIYTSHVSFIITSPKVIYTKMYTKSSQVERRSRESKGKSGTRGLELVRLLTMESSIYCGQLHFDPASESEYANPKNQDI